MGWAQEPQTLNPFIDQDEEDFRVWSLNYDLLVNFSPKDLGPVPGIAEKLGDLAGQEDGHLPPLRGPQVVRRPADHLQGRQVQPRDVRPQQPAVPELRRERHLDRDAGRPDGGHQDQAARRAHRRRPVRLHPARAHLGQAVGQEAHDDVQADAADRRQRALRRLRVQPRPHHPHDAATRTSAARSRSSTRSSGSSTATPTPSTARSRSARSTSSPRWRRRASRAWTRPRTSRRSTPPSPSFTQLAFNLCSKKNCPDAKFNPAVQDVTVRQAIAYAIDRNRINKIASRGIAFEGHGLLPRVLQGVLQAAGRRLPARRRQGQADARRRRAGSPARAASARRAASGCRSTCSCARSRS